MIVYNYILAKYLERIQVRVIADALGINVPYPLPESDVCELFTNTICPVVEGEYTEFRIDMQILDVFPTVSNKCLSALSLIFIYNN